MCAYFFKEKKRGEAYESFVINCAMQKFQIDDEHLIKSIFKCCEALEGFPHN